MLLLARARGKSDGAAIKGRNAILDPRLANGPASPFEGFASPAVGFVPFPFSFLFTRRRIGKY